MTSLASRSITADSYALNHSTSTDTSFVSSLSITQIASIVLLRDVDKLEIWLESSRLKLVDKASTSVLNRVDNVSISVERRVDSKSTSVLIPSDKALMSVLNAVDKLEIWLEISTLRSSDSLSTSALISADNHSTLPSKASSS